MNIRTFEIEFAYTGGKDATIDKVVEALNAKALEMVAGENIAVSVEEQQSNKQQFDNDYEKLASVIQEKCASLRTRFSGLENPPADKAGANNIGDIQ